MNDNEKIERLISMAKQYEFYCVGEYIRAAKRKMNFEDFDSNPVAINALLLRCFEHAHDRDIPDPIRRVMLHF